jgi:hypothetical protein
MTTVRRFAKIEGHHAIMTYRKKNAYAAGVVQAFADQVIE